MRKFTWARNTGPTPSLQTLRGLPGGRACPAWGLLSFVQEPCKKSRSEHCAGL